MPDEQEMPVEGVVSTGRKARKSKPFNAEVEQVSEAAAGGFTMRWPEGLEEQAREVSSSKGLPIGTVRKAVEAAINKAFKQDGRDVATIVKDHLFG